MDSVHLLIDQPAKGAWNMACDEALLLASGRHGERYLRFYQWSRPTLSLGYFQSVELRREHSSSGPCPLVRRATGGGAILHDQELTYSFTAPAADRLARSVTDLYEAFHESLVTTLAEWRIDAALVEQARNDRPKPPFLCFQRRSRGDVVLSGCKVTGSAQRRQHGAVLQHGSILLQSSPFAPELPGIQELSGRSVPADALRDAWSSHLAARLQLRLVPSNWSESQRRDAEQRKEQRYASAAWTNRR
jgi:lipoate-protein ligase A